MCSEDKKYCKEKEEWLSERADLLNRLKLLELSLSSIDTEKKRLDSQYRNYVAQVCLVSFFSCGFSHILCYLIKISLQPFMIFLSFELCLFCYKKESLTRHNIC